MVVFAERDGECSVVQMLAQSSAGIGNDELAVIGRLLLDKWQQHATDRAVIAELLPNAAFHTFEQAGITIDPKSKTLSAGNVELQDLPCRGALRLRGESCDSRAAKVRSSASSSGSAAYISGVISEFLAADIR